jgi:hypothetical protein
MARLRHCERMRLRQGLLFWRGTVGTGGQFAAQHLGRQTPAQLRVACSGVTLLQPGKEESVTGLRHLDAKI